jgi:hypothetical protein
MKWMLKLLKANPKQRFTIEQALKEEYMHKK